MSPGALKIGGSEAGSLQTGPAGVFLGYLTTSLGHGGRGVGGWTAPIDVKTHFTLGQPNPAFGRGQTVRERRHLLLGPGAGPV